MSAKAGRRRNARGPAEKAPLAVMRWLFATLLSLLLTVLGLAVILFGVVFIVAAVLRAVEKGGVGVWVGAAVVTGFSVAVGFLGLRLIGRFRPWLVWRLAGSSVPAIPALFSAMWNSPHGAYSGTVGGGGDGGGGGGG